MIARLTVASVSRTRGPDACGNEDAVGVCGWMCAGDRPMPITLSVPVGPATPLAIAVTDGVGSRPGGADAARRVAELLSRPDPTSAQDPAGAYRRADAVLHDLMTSATAGMACAAATVVLDHTGTATVANVGDVRVYRVVDGYAGILTVDDRTGDGAALSRCLGGIRPGDVDPHVHRTDLRPGDRLLLCTDGLPDPATISVVGADPFTAVDGLLGAARRRGAAPAIVDDTTVVLLDLIAGPAAAESVRADERGPGPEERPAPPSSSPRRWFTLRRSTVT